MSAATIGRAPARGFDRLVLSVGLALVTWSRRRADRALPVVMPPLELDDLRDRPRGFADPHSVESLSMGQGVQHNLFR